MPCIDHEFKNCPAYMELGDGEHCKTPGCQRKKDIAVPTSELSLAPGDDLEEIAIAGKTGGRQGTI